jgi:MFS family permease
MQRTGVSWVIYTMTHSTFMLGLTVFASQFPSFLLSLSGGIVSDRYNRYKILLLTQTLAMIQAVTLAILTLTNHHAVWLILTLSVILGVINAFDVPARQPLIHEMINDKADLPNALALNGVMNNMARLVGPALSGIVLVQLGAGICFLLNAVSFVAVLISLLMMKLAPYQPSTVKESKLNEGFNYLRDTPAIGLVLLLLALISLMILPYNTLLPVFAKVIFKGNAATFGYINSFIGLGAVVSSFFLASQKPGANLKRVLLVNIIIFGICLMCFSQISNFPVAMFFAVLSGYGTMSVTTICNTIVQMDAAADMRGRVISYFAMCVFGMLPLGSLLIGMISEHIGAPNTLFFQGMTALIIAAFFFKFLKTKT